MLPVLALAISLRQASRRPRAPRSPHQPDGTLALIKSEVTRNLIGDAMLEPHDLPPGWVTDHDPGDSLFTGTEFEPLFMSDMRVRFYRPASGEYLDQHVGILPRWALRHYAGELERAAMRTSLGHRRRREHGAHVIEIPPLGDQALALRVPAIDGEAALSVDAVFLRRGAFVMALASWHPDPRRLDVGRTSYLAILADRKWAGVATALS